MDHELRPRPAGGSFAVLRGRPSEDELAAVVLALDAADLDGAAPARPPWLVAARREALGGRPVAAPADLSAGSRPFV